MSRNKERKLIKRGDRIDVHFGRDTPPEFLEWLDSQEDAGSTLLKVLASLLSAKYVPISESEIDK